VLLFASRFERMAVVYGDRAYEPRRPDEWQHVVDG
jgi:hypothetical protein